jgi:hypothetical protein
MGRSTLVQRSRKDRFHVAIIMDGNGRWAQRRGRPRVAALGSDAAPLLVSRLSEVPDDAQCVVASRLLDSWGPERPVDWRNFNVSESRARQAVTGSLVALRSLAGADACAGVEQTDVRAPRN